MGNDLLTTRKNIRNETAFINNGKHHINNDNHFINNEINIINNEKTPKNILPMAKKIINNHIYGY